MQMCKVTVDPVLNANRTHLVPHYTQMRVSSIYTREWGIACEVKKSERERERRLRNARCNNSDSDHRKVSIVTSASVRGEILEALWSIDSREWDFKARIGAFTQDEKRKSHLWTSILLTISIFDNYRSNWNSIRDGCRNARALHQCMHRWYFNNRNDRGKVYCWKFIIKGVYSPRQPRSEFAV